LKSPLPRLMIVVPCYNEEDILKETFQELTRVLHRLVEQKKICRDSKMIFVDDGSTDQTWLLIAKESVRNHYVTGIKLGRNVGHQKALLAGYERVQNECDCAVSIDCDLQDDVDAICEMVDLYRQGFDIVYGVRARRDCDSLFKRGTAYLFYWFMEKTGVGLIPNHGDFRLLSRRALQELSRYRESNLFLRGIIPVMGLPSAKVYYNRKPRKAGKTKYPLKKMVAFAWDGLTSFSISPIRFITLAGFLLISAGLVAGTAALARKLAGSAGTGLTSLLISLWLLGGLHLASIGILGEYIGKIFAEIKNRPKYFVEMDLFSNPLLENRPISGHRLPDGIKRPTNRPGTS